MYIVLFIIYCEIFLNESCGIIIDNPTQCFLYKLHNFAADYAGSNNEGFMTTNRISSESLRVEIRTVSRE